MNSFQTKPPTARQIDDACRKGFFVFTSNRQQILGASNEYKFRVANKNKVWINMERDGEWREVPLRDVIITTEVFGQKEDGMLKGKREGGRPAHHGSAKKVGSGKSAGVKKAAKLVKKSEKAKPEDNVEVNEDRHGQLRVPGTERKTNPKVEKQALLVYDLQTARMDAAKEENAARKVLTRMMKDAGIGEQDLPDDLIAELETDPKAKVHKKKKKRKPNEGETPDDAPDDDE